MRLQRGIESYIEDLSGRCYSQAELRRKGRLLRRHLAHAVALYHPAVPRKLMDSDRLCLYGRGRVRADVKGDRREAVEDLLAVFRATEVKISHLTLGTFLQEYRKEYLAGRPDATVRQRAIDDFCRAVGLEVELRTIDRRTYDQTIECLQERAVQRAASYSAAFFYYCHRQGRLSFNPHSAPRSPYQRIFDPDFLGTENGLWTGRLRLYLEYLRSERNLSDGGIDYYARKLKIFVRWLDEQGTGARVTRQMFKEFLAEKEKQGVKAITLAKYVYSVRYFFDYLLKRGLNRDNPTSDLRLTADLSPEQPILSEQEVTAVIDHLEGQEYESRRAQDVPTQMRHFRALRDLSLFLLFTLTGLRLSEVCGMRLGDVDFTKRSVRIQAKGNRTHRKKHREILLPDALWSPLRRYLRTRPHPGQGRLWISWSGRPMSGPGVSRVITGRVRETGVEKHLSPHRLRATCASLYVKKGMDPFSLKTLLGHQSVCTTMDRYARLTEDELRAVWKKTNPLAGTDDE